LSFSHSSAILALSASISARSLNTRSPMTPRAASLTCLGPRGPQTFRQRDVAPLFGRRRRPGWKSHVWKSIDWQNRAGDDYGRHQGGARQQMDTVLEMQGKDED